MVTRYDNMTLSAVVGVSGLESAASVDETLFSLAIQHRHDIEVVVALPGGDNELRSRVADSLDNQPWTDAARCKLVSVEGPAVARGALLNRGIAEASGRFLTLLDAGRVVAYQHGYAALIERLVESKRAAAAGGCRSALLRSESGGEFVETKYDFTLSGPPLGLMSRRLGPVCSHVFDRSRAGGFDFRFADSDAARARREFLARVYADLEPDLSARHVFVCERRLRAGGLEGMLYGAARAAYALKARLSRTGARRGGGAK